jgi:hypothetical protein
MTTTTTLTFRVEPLDPDRLAALLAAGRDDQGLPIRVHTVTEAGGTPLRCCLREAVPGERAALLGWRLDLPAGPYQEVGPVFVHADGCAGHRTPEQYPAGFAGRTQVQRAYGEDGTLLDSRMVEPGRAVDSLADYLTRPEVAVVHSRNPLHGCYMFAVRRA